MESLGKLVQTYTQDEILLNGFFVEGDKDKPVLIHIHGFEGDPFSNLFVHTIGDYIATKGFSFLTVQTRGTAKSKEFLTTKAGVGRNIGADYELLEEAYLDIDAWLKFLIGKGFTQFVLQGHSLGTVKIVRYMSEGSYCKNVKGLLLLCPFDITDACLVRDNLDEYLGKAAKEVELGRGREIVPRDFEEIDLSYQSYISWYKDTEFRRMFDLHNRDYDFPVLRRLTVPVCAIVGSEDEFFSFSNKGKYSEMLSVLLKQLKKGSGKLLDGTHHDLKGYEDQLATEIGNFINQINQ